jgi:flagellar P-ring protein precursor FlgI
VNETPHPETHRANAISLLLLALSGLLLLALLSAPARAERIKDLASVAGVRSNQLVGYGLVVGLDGTGDKDTDSPYTLQSLRSMLTRLGVQVPPGVKIKPRNVAAVLLSAELPPFAKVGQRIDVTASSLGNAKSLRGGTLLMAPLKGPDGLVYGIAQGSLLVSGLSASGADGSKVTVNAPNVGRIPGGATVERTVATPFASGNTLTLNLHQTDFTTAKRVTDAINQAVGPGVARAIDAAAVEVSAPADPGQRVSFMALLEELTVQPGAPSARVIVNSRTGTVVMNDEVRVLPSAVSHGSLTVTISEEIRVSQPEPFSAGGTAVVPRSDVEVVEQARPMFKFAPGPTLDEVVRAVNDVGASPSDLVAILEALKEAGALKAELIVI